MVPFGLFLVFAIVSDLIASFQLSDITSSKAIIGVSKLRICRHYAVAALNSTELGFVVFEWLDDVKQFGRDLAKFSLTNVQGRSQDFEIIHDIVRDETVLFTIFKSSTSTERNLQAFRLNELTLKNDNTSRLAPFWNQSHSADKVLIDYHHSVLVVTGPNIVDFYDIREPLNPIHIRPERVDQELSYKNSGVEKGQIIATDETSIYKVDIAQGLLLQEISPEPIFNGIYRVVKIFGEHALILRYSREVVRVDFSLLETGQKNSANTPLGFYPICTDGKLWNVYDERINSKKSFSSDFNRPEPDFPSKADPSHCKDIDFYASSVLSAEKAGNLLMTTFSVQSSSTDAISFIFLFDVKDVREMNVINVFEFFPGVISDLQYRNGALVYVYEHYGIVVRHLIAKTLTEQELLNAHPDSDYGYPKNSLVIKKGKSRCPKTPIEVTTEELIVDKDAAYPHLAIRFEVVNFPSYITLERCDPSRGCQLLNHTQPFFAQHEVLRIVRSERHALPETMEPILVNGTIGHGNFKVTADIPLQCADDFSDQKGKVPSKPVETINTSNSTLPTVSSSYNESAVSDRKEKTSKSLGVHEYVIGLAMSLVFAIIIVLFGALIWFRRRCRDKARNELGVACDERANFNTLMKVPDGLLTTPSMFNMFSSRTALMSASPSATQRSAIQATSETHFK